jgi:precorrin-4/cobalt-precorrin-4 C11-methyltransferase
MGIELTIPEVTQSIILTRTAMKSSPMPEGEELENLARTKATLAIHLSVRNLREIEQVLAPVYGAECPVVIAYRVGWPDQQFLYGTLSNIRKKVMEAKITRTALIFVGRGLNHDDAFRDSALYDKDHVHVLRVKRGNKDEREE